MDFETIRTQALSLPEVTEAPHFTYTSFRVRGKIFMTVPPEASHAHLFVSEEDREMALALYPESVEKLMWGARVAGVRVALATVKPALMSELIRKAWLNKAPKRLAASVSGETR